MHTLPSLQLGQILSSPPELAGGKNCFAKISSSISTTCSIREMAQMINQQPILVNGQLALNLHRNLGSVHESHLLMGKI
jgi:hypothetical protein